MKKFTIFMKMFFASMLLLITFSSFGQTILVVDRDGSSWYPDGYSDVWPIYMETLDDIGYDYEYWEVINATDDGPDANYMSAFDIVIWFTGEAWANGETVTVNDEIQLSLYLELGGKLFMSAQDYLYDRYPDAGVLNPGEFPYEYFGLREVTQDVWNIDTPNLASCDGVTGSLAQGYDFEIQDLYTTARDGLFIDDLIDHVGQSVFYIWDPAPEGNIAVQYETDVYRIVFTTGSFACIVDYWDRIDLMTEIVDWLMNGSQAECYPYFDEFEDYTAGGYLAEQADCWTTWSSAPGTGEDAFVVDEMAFSGLQSVKIEGSTTDLVFPLGDMTEGEYKVSMMIYVPQGYGGYYNVLQVFDGNNSKWGFEVYFGSDGSGYINAAGLNAATFNYPPGEWFESIVLVDLYDDYAEYWINDTRIYDWQWSIESNGDPGVVQLGAVDIYASAPTGDDVMLFFDDFYYNETAGVGIGSQAAPLPVAIFPNPAGEMVTLQSAEILGQVRIFNNIGQIVFYQKVDNQELRIKTSDFQTGIYTVQIESENGIVTEKLIIN